MDELQAWAASLPPHTETAPMDKIDTSTGLLPCPFCGGDAKHRTLTEGEFCNAGADVIECSQCCASSHVEFGRKENLVDAWNRRALVPALSAENADLRAKLDAAVESLEEIAAEASVSVHTWRNGINFKKMYEGWRKIATGRINIARAALAKIKGADNE